MKVTARLRSLTKAGSLAMAGALLVGCGAGVGSESGKPHVVASFYPLQYVAERVAGEHAEVTNLTSPGAEPHDLELDVRQTAELSDADLAVYQKGLQPAVDDAIEQNGPEHVLDVTAAADLQPAAGQDQQLDPHFWLDPLRLAQVAAAVEKQLAEVDPDRAAAYQANLEALQTDLVGLDKDLEAGLSSCRIDTVVVSHDAFGYLARYGPRFEAINGLSPDAEPSPAHIAELHDLIESDGITTVFSETLASKQMAESIAGDLGLEAAVLDPIEGLSDATAGEDYLSLMRSNLAALQEANQCR
jgi:zinc transport system substrate-binding protein